jgi:hypothetical protein
MILLPFQSALKVLELPLLPPVLCAVYLQFFRRFSLRDCIPKDVSIDNLFCCEQLTFLVFVLFANL